MPVARASSASLLHETLEGSVKERLELTCGDVSQDMVNVVQQRITDGGWNMGNGQIVDAHVSLCVHLCLSLDFVNLLDIRRTRVFLIAISAML